MKNLATPLPKPLRGGVAGGAGGAAAPPGFWMGSGFWKKILGKTTEFGKKLLRIGPLLLNL